MTPRTDGVRMERCCTRKRTIYPKALIYRPEERFTSDGTERVRILTEVTFIDGRDEAIAQTFRVLGAKFLAEDAYVLDVCNRLDLR
jgi:hypothetical protein